VKNDTSNSASTGSAHRRISRTTAPRYPLVVQSKALLNQSNGRERIDRDYMCGFNSSAASAGLSDNALNADSSTDTAMVRANCL